MLRYFVLLLFLSTTLPAQQPAPPSTKSPAKAKHGKAPKPAKQAKGTEQKAQVEMVFICTGGFATKYHAYKSCPGLNNCRGAIRETDKPANGSPCKRCH